MSNKIIFVPFSYSSIKQTSKNMLHRNNPFDDYCKVFCVALVSIKEKNQNCDVALVTDTDIPLYYKAILERNGILIFHVAFESFVFPDQYPWCLAFYKLCALKSIVENYKYDYVCYVDADVIANKPFDPIWKECDYNILLYDINHGRQVPNYRVFLEELSIFLGTDTNATQYGGEFFAANINNAKIFISSCLDIYNKIIERNFTTTKGDEFILTIFAHQNKLLVKNAGAYIYRFWTGHFRLVSTCYKANSICILHLPDEKTGGIIKIFNRYIRKNKFPSTNKIYSLCHLTHAKFLLTIKQHIRKILNYKS